MIKDNSLSELESELKEKNFENAVKEVKSLEQKIIDSILQGRQKNNINKTIKNGTNSVRWDSVKLSEDEVKTFYSRTNQILITLNEVIKILRAKKEDGEDEITRLLMTSFINKTIYRNYGREIKVDRKKNNIFKDFITR